MSQLKYALFWIYEEDGYRVSTEHPYLAGVFNSESKARLAAKSHKKFGGKEIHVGHRDSSAPPIWIIEPISVDDFDSDFT